MTKIIQFNFFWGHVLQYFLPFAAKGINKHIEEAILRADKLGVKVISLAALNKVHFLSLSLLLLIQVESLLFSNSGISFHAR